jgi:hypothetical protein
VGLCVLKRRGWVRQYLRGWDAGLEKPAFHAVTYLRHGKYRLENPLDLLRGDFVLERRHWQLHRQ